MSTVWSYCNETVIELLLPYRSPHFSYLVFWSKIKNTLYNNNFLLKPTIYNNVCIQKKSMTFFLF